MDIGYPNRIVVLGKQGSGKGTQCAALSSRLKLPHVSAGAALRLMAREESPLGRNLARLIASGELVSDSLVLATIAAQVARSTSGGYVIDGYPRNALQARSLVESDEIPTPGIVVQIEVSEAEVVDRMMMRRVCTGCGLDFSGRQDSICGRCGGKVGPRADDTPDAIRRRLEISKQHESSVIAYLSEHCEIAAVDGSGSPEEVSARIWNAIEGLRPLGQPQEPEVSTQCPINLVGSELIGAGLPAGKNDGTWR